MRRDHQGSPLLILLKSKFSRNVLKSRGAVLRYQVQTIFFSFSFVVVQSVLLKYIQEMGVEHKTRNYKTPRGEHRQNTLRHTSQQDPL